LGSAVSHGCVRLSTANATQLFQLVKAEGMPNTKVEITGQQPYGEPEAYNQPSQGAFGGNSFFGQNSYDQNGQNAYGQNSYGQNSAKQLANGKRNKSQPNDTGLFPFFDSRN
jgi:hypothetical protein